jgi:transposase
MRQDARENRERILAAAEHVFGSRGETGSTEEVARLAGVGIATVFRRLSRPRWCGTLLAYSTPPGPRPPHRTRLQHCPR